MSFLAPWWILLAGAAAVPLLIHLLRRQSAVRTEFPATRYLQRAAREHSTALRLRNLLLMLLRVLVVLLLAAAAARPLARIPGVGGGRTPTALAIVLDNSLSTSVIQGAGPVLETLRDSARLLVDAAAPTDRVWIVTADGRRLGGAPVAARAALDSVEALAGAGDLQGALAQAEATVMAAGGFAPRIALFTDGQRTAWKRPVSIARRVRVTVHSPRSAAPPNRGIAQLAPRPERWMPRGALALRVVTSDPAEDSVAFHVALGAARATPRTVARGIAVTGAETSVRLAPTDTGWVAGFAESERDDLPGDDRRWFAVWAGAAPAVGSSAGAGPFVRSAVDVLRSDGRVRAGSDVLLLAAGELPQAGGNAAVLVMPPVRAADIGAANRALARRGIPWRFAGRVAGRLTSPASLDGVDVPAAYTLEPTRALPFDTLAMLGTQPWAVAAETGGARYVLIASPLHPDATELPVRAPFVPWLATVIHERLAGSAGRVVLAAPGGMVDHVTGADSLLLASGSVVAIEPRSAAPLEPGVHFYMRGGVAAGALVVNAEESESVLARLGQDEVAGNITGAEVTVASRSRSWRAATFAGDGATSLVLPALAAALLLLVVEVAATAARTRGAG